MVIGQNHDNSDDAGRERALAEAVRAACAQVAEHAYNDAAIQGLCSEGAAEVAAGAIRSLDLTPFLDSTVPEKEDRVARPRCPDQ